MNVWRGFGILAAMVLHSVSLHAQTPEFRTMRAGSCDAADSLVGPITKAQRNAVVRASESREGGAVSVLTGAIRGLKPRFMVIGELPGPEPSPAPQGSLMILVPAEDARASAANGAHVRFLLDHSLSLDLGVPKLPREEGTIRATRLPVVVALSPATLVAIARAGTAEASLDSVELELRPDELADINLYYRLARCGLLRRGKH